MSMIELLTAILVFVTGFYAWVTFGILKANNDTVRIMKQQVDSLIRPYITINAFLNPRHPLFYIKISNTGKTAAQNLRLEIDRPFYQYGRKNEDHNIANFSAFQEPFVSFSPGASLIFALAQGFVIFGKDAKADVTPKQFSVKATYMYAGATIVEITHIDLQPYLNSQSEPYPLIDELEKIGKAIEKSNKT